MDEITSAANPLIKKIIKLRDKKYRKQLGLFVAEGKRWIMDCLNSNLYVNSVESLLFKNSLKEELLPLFKTHEYKIFVVSDDVFNTISDTENSQGVLAVLKMPCYDTHSMGNCILLLDRVRDPGNMGTIIRTACAAGFNDIMLNDCVDVYNSKVVRSCMTGLLFTKFYNVDIALLKEQEYHMIAADIDGKNLFEFSDVMDKFCLIIGNEANGISETFLQLCNHKISIPMQNMESLNASVSAGILMYNLKQFNLKK